MSIGIAAVYCTVVRYLRMLSNALAAGALAACYIIVLVLQLNPGLSVHPLRLLPVIVSIGLFYTIIVTAIFYAALAGRQLLGRDHFSPGWISVVVLAWCAMAASAAGAALMWVNVRTFRLVLEPETAAAMSLGVITLVVAALLFAAVGLARRHAGRRLKLTWAACFVAIAAASVAAPLAWRGRGQLPPLEARPLDPVFDAPIWGPSSRVVLLAVDAASLEFITNATAEGRLPNFGRLLDAGAVLHLATLHPTSAEAVWTAVATGKLPQKNGVRSAGLYRPTAGGDALRLLPDFCFAQGAIRLGLLSDEPHTSATVRARPVWSILGSYGVSVGVVNWPLTYPAPAVRGYLLSDLFAQLTLVPEGADDQLLVYPQDLRAELLPMVQEAIADAPDVAQTRAVGALDVQHRVQGGADRVHDRLAAALAVTRPTQVTFVRYESLDPVGHYFLRYAEPSKFGDVSDAERREFGAVLERQYMLIDDAIGRAIAGLEAGDVLLVVSGYGMEPLGLGKRLLERIIGDPNVSGSHEAAPDGFLMAYGAQIARAPSLRRGSVVDVVPTILYFLGLPVARDMDGSVRTDLFERAFTDAHPITFIPSYER
jgi:predicted AlkP superfamily phosphohydrolase/phosphomutase